MFTKAKNGTSLGLYSSTARFISRVVHSKVLHSTQKKMHLLINDGEERRVKVRKNISHNEHHT
jgi:hypothetical protein